jgi:hypothetical protein
MSKRKSIEVEHSRPARHVTEYPYFRRNVVIQLEAYAVVD